MKKKALGITLMLAMGLSAQFVQVDSLMSGNMAQAVGMQQAEAGIMNGFAGSVDKMKHKAVSSAKKEAKAAVKKALDIDMNGMNDHIKAMKAHLELATHFTAGAQYKLEEAAGLQNNSHFNELGNISNVSRSNFSDLGSAYRYAAIPGVDSNIGNMIETKLNSQDEQAKKKTLERLSWAKEDRSMATWYKALALRDAVFVVKEAAKGIAQAGKSGSYQDVLNTLKQYKAVADDTQSICKNLGTKTGDMDKALKKVDANNNIKAPSKDRQKQIANSIMPE